jgi:outer membrane lipoprotein SlyB
MKPATVLSTILLALLAQGCATTTTSATTWTAAPPSAAWVRAGHVESVSEIVERTEGNPAGGALAGALIGGFLFGGHGHASLFGAATGAAVGAATSQGVAESRRYQVLVRFDDGSSGMFVYRGYSPFRPGQPVVLTPQGLSPASPTTLPGAETP